jgi:hypothetical protein
MSNNAIPDDSSHYGREQRVPDGAASTQKGKFASVNRLRTAAASLEVEGEGFLTRPALKRYRRVRPCGLCNGKLVRVSRTTLPQFVVSCFGVYPYVCEHCGVRVFRANYKQLIAAICLAGVALVCFAIGLSYTGLAIRKVASLRKSPAEVAGVGSESTSARPATAPRALTNEDILELIRSNMTPSFVMTLIRQEDNRFQVDAKSLTALKRDGVPEDVIIAMVQAAEASKERSDSSPAPQ